MSVFAPQVRIECGDALALLRREPAGSVDCCVTSPPYWGLRDYGCEGQLGLEPTPDLYVAHLVDVFAEVRRVLRDDGVLWLNLGDSYAGGGHGSRDSERWPKQSRNDHTPVHAKKQARLKPKDLVGIPWRVAFALQADGWYLRSDIVWAKTAPMPEGVRDRPTRAHEFVFLLSKSARYRYDADAIREPIGDSMARAIANGPRADRQYQHDEHNRFGKRSANRTFSDPDSLAHIASSRNARDVWTLNPDPYPGAHFAVMPEELARRCILAGCPAGGTVLDPFAGSGTVGAVAARHGRNAVLFDLNPDYCAMARRRVWPEAQPRLRLALRD